MKITRLFLHFAFVLMALPAILSGQEPELSADEPIAFESEKGLLVATGNAVFRDRNTLVKAEQIRYHRRTGRVEAEGNVRVTREGLRVLSERLEYDTASRRIESGPFRAGYPPLFLEGNSFSGTLEELDFSKVSVYFREPSPDAPSLSIEEGKWVVDESIRGRGLKLNLVGSVGLPLPGLEVATEGTQATLEGSLGYREQLGAYARAALLYPFRSGLSGGGNLHLYTRRGVLLGPRLAAEGDNASMQWKFALDGGWIADQGEESELGEDILGNAIGNERGYLHAEGRIHDIRDQSGWQLRAATGIRSDSEILRDFRPDLYRNFFQPDSHIDTSLQNGRFLLSTLARWQLNEDSTLVERLPDVSLQWLPGPFGQTNWNWQASLNLLRYRLQEAAEFPLSIPFPEGPLGLTSPFFPSPFFPAGAAGDLHDSPVYDRLGGQVTLTRAFALPFGLQLDLRAGGLWREYRREAGRGQAAFDEESLVGELGADLTQSLAKTYPLEKAPFGLEAVRHVSRVALRYRWHPREDEKWAEAPLPGFRPYLPQAPVLDLAALDDLDRLPEWSVLRMEWEHRLLGAFTDGERRDLLRLRLLQDIRLDAPEDSDEWEAAYLETRFTPLPFLDLLWRQKVRTEDGETESNLVGVSLYSSDLWSMEFLATYLQNAIETYQLRSRYRLNENYGLSGYWEYDARLKAWTEQRYGLTRRFGNSWRLETYVAFTDENRRDAEFSVGLRVTLLSF
ncbi:MAG: hypothetical protein GVY10_06870 [Verrucomicrobia bacterium]|nr:hypothetical protein [Verrucomicrobiota bacterium]